MGLERVREEADPAGTVVWAPEKCHCEQDRGLKLRVHSAAVWKQRAGRRRGRRRPSPEFSWSAVLCGQVACLSKAQFPHLTNEINHSMYGMRWWEGPVRNAWARPHPVCGTKQLLYSALTMSGTRCSNDEQEIAVPSWHVQWACKQTAGRGTPATQERGLMGREGVSKGCMKGPSRCREVSTTWSGRRRCLTASPPRAFSGAEGANPHAQYPKHRLFC